MKVWFTYGSNTRWHQWNENPYYLR